jgi:hypothetical protein
MNKGTSPEIELITTVICEDIRREDNGKPILIGVYPTDMIIANLPATIVLCIYMNVKTKKEGNYETKLRIIGQTGQIIVAPIPISIKMPNMLSTLVIIKGILAQLQAEGKISIQWQAPGAAWATISIIDVRVGAVPGATGFIPAGVPDVSSQPS